MLGAGHRFADGFGISGVVLARLNVGLDELRRHQAHRVAHACELARPVVGAGACLDADEARRQVDEERGHLVTAKLLPQHSLAVLVDSMHLEHVLCQVDANSRNLHGGRPSRFSGW